MMSKILVAVAIAATQLSSASACGWFNEKCCDIPDNNPNKGTCYDPRNVCWEGKCMGCGTNGMIKCPTKPYCEEGNILNKDGWCSTDPNETPEPNSGCDKKCSSGKVCFYGQCLKCGDNGQPKCLEGKACKDGNVENDDGFCTTAPHEVDDSPCGDVDWPCCNKAQREYLNAGNDSCSKTDNGVCCNGVCKEDSCDDSKAGKDGKAGKSGKKWRWSRNL